MDFDLFKALQGINLLVAQLVKAGEKHKYKLRKNTNEPEWENTWTAGNAILFTMSSLTLIGKIMNAATFQGINLNNSYSLFK